MSTHYNADSKYYTKEINGTQQTTIFAHGTSAKVINGSEDQLEKWAIHDQH